MADEPSTEHTEPQRLENGEDRLDSEEKQINSTSTTTPPAQTEEQSNAASSTTDTPVESPDVNQPSGQASTESTSAMRAMASFYSMVDDHLLQTIELNAKQTAMNLSALMGHLRLQLQTLSSLSVQYMKLHQLSVMNATVEVSESIRATQMLIEKSRQLNAELAKVESLYTDVKKTKQLLDQFEALVNHLTKPTQPPKR